LPGFGAFAVTADGKRTRKKIAVSQNETVFQQMAEIFKFTPDFTGHNISVFQTPMTSIIDYLTLFKIYSSGRFNLDKLVSHVTKGTNQRLSYDGSDLASVLLWLQRNDMDNLIKYREMISPVFHTGKTVDLILDPREGAYSEIIVVVNGKSFYLSDLSDGTLKMMLLASLLNNTMYPFSTLLIDEPELNLHPEWQERFISWMLNSNSSKQYFISTHSPEILDSLTDSFIKGDTKVFIFSLDGSITPLALSKVQEWLSKKVNLGDLYRGKAIEIGGWA
jgi:hypothetical protein